MEEKHKRFNRQFSNAIEILATEKEWWHFPKSFGTTREFKVTNYNKGILSFEVREGKRKLGSFVVFTGIDYNNPELQDKGNAYLIAYFAKQVSKEMFMYHKLQLK